MPYLFVEVDDQFEAKAEAATELRLDMANSRSARLTLTSPLHGFAYEVNINGKLLDRHNIPLVINGRKQTIPLQDLSPSIVADQPYEILEIVRPSRNILNFFWRFPRADGIVLHSSRIANLLSGMCVAT